MNKSIVLPDILWNLFLQWLPKKSKKGRPEYDIKKTLIAIFFIIKTGCQWNHIPRELGASSTIHGKFMVWVRAGVFNDFFDLVKNEYEAQQEINNWLAIDTSSRKAPFARFGGKNPTDRAKQGVKIVLAVDRKGVPLFVNVAPANKHDSKLFIPLFKSIKKSKNLIILTADSAFDVKKLRSFSKEKNMILLASKNIRRSKNEDRYFPLHRWIVERTFGIFSWWRGLKTCYAKVKESYLAFVQIASVDQMIRAL